jgi:hypothetical protein
MDANDPDTDRRLQDALADVETALKGILPGGVILDPDHVLHSLSANTPAIELALSELMRENTGAPGGELNRAAAEAIELAIESAPFVLIVRNELCSMPIPLRIDEVTLSVVLARCLRLLAEHVGAGGELVLRTAVEQDAATLTIAAERGADSVATLPLETRCESLREFLVGEGGSLQVRPDSRRRLVVELRFLLALAR